MREFGGLVRVVVDLGRASKKDGVLLVVEGCIGSLLSGVKSGWLGMPAGSDRREASLAAWISIAENRSSLVVEGSPIGEVRVCEWPSNI